MPQDLPGERHEPFSVLNFPELELRDDGLHAAARPELKTRSLGPRLTEDPTSSCATKTSTDIGSSVTSAGVATRSRQSNSGPANITASSASCAETRARSSLSD